MIQSSNPSRKIQWGRVFIYSVLIIGAFISIVPFLYMIMAALKSYGSIVTNNLWPWFPLGTESLQWENFPEAIKTVGTGTLKISWDEWTFQWKSSYVAIYFVNSLIVTLSIVSGVLFTSMFAAYTFAYIEVPGKNFLFMIILGTIMIPSDLTLVPKVVMMYNFKWYNTYAALIVPFLVSVFGIFLMRQFFMQIPRDLFDAALIDGANHWQYLIQIVVPLSRPAIITTALLNFIWAWDSFKWPMLVTRDSNMRVLAVGLQQFMSGEGTKVQLLMAFAAMVIVPVIVFYFFTQRYFTESVTRTGIKG